MTWVINSLSVVLVIVGLLFTFVGSLGLIRLPDFFSRTHAASKADTLGIVILLAGLAVHEGVTLNGFKLLIGIVFVGLANPVVAHALARAALRFGVKPWTRKDSEKAN